MASLKALKLRIGSVKSTQKITKAMKMVAAAKLRRAQQGAEAGRPYSTRMSGVVSSLAAKVARSPESPKLLVGTGKDDTHLIVVATSDRGLAGAFNSNIVRAARRKADELIAQGKTVLFYIVGRKGRPVLQRVYPRGIVGQLTRARWNAPAYPTLRRSRRRTLWPLPSEVDVVHLAYANFARTLAQEPTINRSFGVPLPPQQDAGGVPGSSASSMSPTRKRSWPSFCRPQLSVLIFRSCSRTWPASTARR
jgi:F-type H+-transporting ATPase subunit gamma